MCFIITDHALDRSGKMASSQNVLAIYSCIQDRAVIHRALCKGSFCKNLDNPWINLPFNKDIDNPIWCVQFYVLYPELYYNYIIYNF